MSWHCPFNPIFMGHIKGVENIVALSLKPIFMGHNKGVENIVALSL